MTLMRASGAFVSLAGIDTKSVVPTLSPDGSMVAGIGSTIGILDIGAPPRVQPF